VIVIGTSAGREHWATDALASLTGHGVLVLSQYEYELGKLRWVLDHTDIQRFWFLQDSVIIHDADFLHTALDMQGAVALCADPVPYGMYMGVYDRALLQEVGIPHVTDKRHAIRLEVEWTQAYCAVAASITVLFPELADRNASGIEDRHGRPNLILSNQHLTKYKGTWR
jgi:hypothetical protein